MVHHTGGIEDEDIGDPDLFPDDVGDAPGFGVAEFVQPSGGITFYEPHVHMGSVDFDAMRAPQFSDMPRLTSSVHESNQKTFFAKCVKYGNGCNWKIQVSKLKRTNRWQITKYSDKHRCLRTSIDQDHRKLDSSVISHYVMKLVEANPRVPVSMIQATIAQQFGYQIKYKKGWRARDKAMESVYGDYDKSYNELPALLLAMTHFIPDTIVRYQTNDAFDQEGQLVDGHKYFHRLFWAFKFCIEGFPYCKRMIQVDGTWLYGRYSHVLLIAVA
ncbi:hypothetical protein V6N12_074451 [Hibiscus sabdariffa]|uniref:Transposase MuDR plant domain-containing protein n=1 Tax=Hibiscus sabdariffa TaxID=183260 RepID=A0ABR2BL72_9ROSI